MIVVDAARMPGCRITVILVCQRDVPCGLSHPPPASHPPRRRALPPRPAAAPRRGKVVTNRCYHSMNRPKFRTDGRAGWALPGLPDAGSPDESRPAAIRGRHAGSASRSYATACIRA